MRTANPYLCGILFQSYSASVRNIVRSFWHKILDKDRLSNTCKMLVEVSLLPPSIWSGIFNRDCLDLSLWTHWSTCAVSYALPLPGSLAFLQLLLLSCSAVKPRWVVLPDKSVLDWLPMQIRKKYTEVFGLWNKWILSAKRIRLPILLPCPLFPIGFAEVARSGLRSKILDSNKSSNCIFEAFLQKHKSSQYAKAFCLYVHIFVWPWH